MENQYRYNCHRYASEEGGECTFQTNDFHGALLRFEQWVLEDTVFMATVWDNERGERILDYKGY